jgi:peptidoglycan hydrolase-like protein with peptidoglycan-binding domain
MAVWPVEQVASTGVDVRAVQYLLRERGHPTVVDGIFGPATESAVQAFQAAEGLTADGTVGDQTWAALIVQVDAGDSGDAVRAVQTELRSQGWRLAVDGAFGPQTDRRVRDFQTARALVADGIVGPLTWHALVARFRHVASPEAAVAHLFDAWAANDRRAAETNATPAAVDMLLRGDHGAMLTDAGCAPYPQLGPEDFLCSKFYEGGGINLHVRGNPTDGFYVESVSFVVD